MFLFRVRFVINTVVFVFFFFFFFFHFWMRITRAASDEVYGSFVCLCWVGFARVSGHVAGFDARG